MENPYQYTHGEDDSKNKTLESLRHLVESLPSDLDQSKVLISDLRVIRGKKNSLEWKYGDVDMWSGPEWGIVGVIAVENLEAIASLGIKIID